VKEQESEGLGELEARVQAFVDKWAKPLGLKWWEISICYVYDPASVLSHFRNDDGVTFFKVYPDWRYMTAKIYANAPEVESLDDYQLEKFVLHELCHILVHEMREGEIHHEERVVTTLQHAFMWTWRAGKGELA
jgi:hypothetical protein